MTSPDHHYKLPPGLSDSERERIAGLASVFRGHACSDGYFFSPIRGQKFELLVKTGWRNAGTQQAGPGRKDRPIVRHPELRRIFVVSQAIPLAQDMLKQPQEIEETP